jgi:hypothetical protein
VPSAAAAVAAPAVWRNSRRVSSVEGVSLIAVLRVGERGDPTGSRIPRAAGPW